MPIRGIVALVVGCLLSFSLFAQQYRVEGTFVVPERGRVTLRIYTGDSTFTQQSAKVQGNHFVFEGPVLKPTYAEMTHKRLPAPVPLYIEPGNITVEIDNKKPDASRITGSRSNSEYRILREEFGDGHEVKSEFYESVYAAHILSANVAEETLPAHFQQLRGEGRTGYHYHQLERRLRRLMATTDGCQMPDFVFHPAKGSAVHLNAVRDTNGYTVLLFSTSYCTQCHRAEKELKKRKGCKTVVCPIDNEHNGWDADYVRMLAIDHIPYLILIDKQGTIVARDVRWWEIDRLMVHQ